MKLHNLIRYEIKSTNIILVVNVCDAPIASLHMDESSKLNSLVKLKAYQNCLS